MQTNEISTIVTVSENACQYIENYMQSSHKTGGFRIAVKKSGCSGFSYVIDVVEKPQADDLLMTQNSLQIFVAADSVAVVRGMTIDVKDKGYGQKELAFDNPNAEQACGCGESFTVKAEK